MSKKNIWISTEDITRKEGFVKQEEKEFFDVPLFNDLSDEKVVGELSSSTNRRDFLKYLGFSLGAATIAAACETPVRKAVPYLDKPDAIVPGVATYYASSYARGGEFCPIVVKTREGRPIKIEGNELSPITKGGTSARTQASVLDLYDGSRLKNPARKNGEEGWEILDWETLDAEVKSGLNADSEIRIVTHTDMGFTSKRIIEEFKNVFPGTKVVTYDPISSSAILLANERNFGIQAIPNYRFDKADVIVNFGADFLATWISPIEYARQFSSRKRIKGVDGGNVCRLIQFESNMSYTGSNADHRIQIKPSEQGLAIAKLYNLIAKFKGGSPVTVSGDLSDPGAEQSLQHIANDLIESESSLIVSGSNQTKVQVMVNALNQLLSNYSTTIDLKNPSYQRQGIDADFNTFIDELKSGSVDAIIFLGDANPAYDHPKGQELASALTKSGLTISCSCFTNETQDLCKYICPVPHYLESWDDLHPKAGYYCIIQPAIHPLYNTRSYQESLMVWSSILDTPNDKEEDVYYSKIRQNWEERLFPRLSQPGSFQRFWDLTLHDGFVLIPDPEVEEPVFSFDNVDFREEWMARPDSGIEIAFYESVGVGGGQFANNPWLQEMPDPVTRVVWDNVVHIPVRWNGRDAFEYMNDLEQDGWLVDLTVGGNTLRFPIVRQFGQMEGTVAVALGYGRHLAGKAGSGIGKNCFPMLTDTDQDGNIQYFGSDVRISEKAGIDPRFASVQHHHTLGLRGPDESEGGEIINVDEKVIMTLGTGMQGGLTKRSILRYANQDELPEAVEALKQERSRHTHLNEQTLYPDRSEFYGMGHHWGMSIDLSACIGCGACQVACIAENNVPIVGKVEVNRHHEMTWLRIDRYYYGDVANPSVVYQPMLCQHCDNAPCENVCPVSATNHSSEGINQMAYNRCVGTRYCANNCPYKVRRFNWLDYTTADTFPANEPNPFDEDVPFYGNNLIRMVLNPDVTVRSRGVMEKCSMCVQRIQAGKLTAKSEGRRLEDGEIKTACQMACPTDAIVFGDMNDEGSHVTQLLKDPKNYHVLEEVNTKSSVGYLMKVTNRNKSIDNKDS